MQLSGSCGIRLTARPRLTGCESDMRFARTWPVFQGGAADIPNARSGSERPVPEEGLTIRREDGQLRC